MTQYLSLFRTEQKIIFDLGNLINNVYTGSFNVTFSASYFTSSDATTAPADIILPISAHRASNNMPSVYQLPSDVASNQITLPQNLRRAVCTVAATGQADEEVRLRKALPCIDTLC